MDQGRIGWYSLVSARIYAEGGGSRSVDIELRQGFKQLWEPCGFQGRLPRMFPSGSRSSAYEDFKNHVRGSIGQDFVAMLIDSEEPIRDVDRTWDHLAWRRGDDMPRPKGANDDQVLFMTTCMETWIAADRHALRDKYSRGEWRENALPPLTDLESRSGEYVFNCLRRATGERYEKGEESFRVLGALNPDTLEEHLPSFRRARRILNEKL